MSYQQTSHHSWAFSPGNTKQFTTLLLTWQHRTFIMHSLIFKQFITLPLTLLTIWILCFSGFFFFIYWLNSFSCLSLSLRDWREGEERDGEERGGDKGEHREWGDIRWEAVHHSSYHSRVTTAVASEGWIPTVLCKLADGSLVDLIVMVFVSWVRQPATQEITALSLILQSSLNKMNVFKTI